MRAEKPGSAGDYCSRHEQAWYRRPWPNPALLTKSLRGLTPSSSVVVRADSRGSPDAPLCATKHDLDVTPPPWKIKVVEPIALRSEPSVGTRSRRRATTPSGSAPRTSSSTCSPTAAPRRSRRSSGRRWSSATRPTPGRAASSGSRRRCSETYGYRHVIPTHQGRGAEHLLAKLLVSRGDRRVEPLLHHLARARRAGRRRLDRRLDPGGERPGLDAPVQGQRRPRRAPRVLAACAPERIAFVRVEACLNMAGGQPFSLENLARVRELDPRARRAAHPRRDSDLGERALRQGPRAGSRTGTFPELIREIADLSDGAVFSSKKDHFVPIGGVLALNGDDLASRRASWWSSTKASPTTGASPGPAWRRSRRGSESRPTRRSSRHYVSQSAFLGGLLLERGIPIVVPLGAHAVFLDAKRFLPHLPQEQFPAQALAAALYLAGGVRSMERGIVSGQHGTSRTTGSSWCG